MSARHNATASSPKSLASAISAKTNWGGHGFLHCPGAKLVQPRNARQLIGRWPFNRGTKCCAAHKASAAEERLPLLSK
eukprot:13055520-Heterocapsa_arctica.AAC.1